MNFISVCSGIEAASVAFRPLGWKAIAFSEIEPFPCAVLAHHYPETPNMGDMSKFREWPEELFVQADVIVGGPPCQAFSVAGLRNGLNDERGNLTLIYAEMINHADAVRFIHGKPPVIVLYENVPGLLSDKTGAYGCFLAALAGESLPLEPAGGRWTDAGCVFGPKRAIAWRVLDAQYFQLAQRRRRVFVVASARKGFDPATVLFEWDGMRRDSPPSREARQTAPTIPARSTAGGGLGTDFDCDGGLIEAYGIRTANTSSNGWGIQDEATHTSDRAMGVAVAHTLRGEGFDAGEDGTGRGTPLVPHVVGALACNTGPNGHDAGNFACNQAVDAGHVLPVAFDTTQITSATNRSNPLPGDPCHPLAAGAHAPAIAFPANLSGTQCASTEDLAPSMGAANPTAVAYGIRTANTSSNGWGIQEEVTHTLDCAQGVTVAVDTYNQVVTGDTTQTLCSRGGTTGGVSHLVPAVLSAMRVRRLTPTEAEKLQGFEPGYTAIPWRGKPADQCPDGPRYRALGNSWAVTVVSWIGRRIQEAINGNS